MTSTGAIERKALGRHGIVGSLYDIRTDTLEGGNLFNKELPESFIRLQDSANVSYHIDFNNSQKETFNNMNIEASLKLSLLGGLIDVAGSAKYLKQTKTNSHTVRVTFMYKAKTKQEHLLINTADLYKYFSLDALENPNATHVVIGIIWGANVAATFERVVENREAVEQLEGQLSVVLKSIAGSIEGNAKVNCGDINKAAFESLTVSFSGDVLIKDCPQTIDAVMKTYVNIPDLIKPLNGGKGRQLEFVLYPLKRIAQMFKFELKVERLIKEVSEHLVFRIENIFEQISMTTRKFNDFLDDIKSWEQYIPKDWLKVIKEKKATHAGDELKTQRQMASLLQKIRSGTTEESEMEELIDKFDLENPCSELLMDKFLKENQHVKTKIETLKKISPDQSLLLTQIESVEDIILDFYDNDVYLLHICEQWSKKNKRNMLKQLRFFSQLKKNYMNDIFRVIDHDLHPSLDEKPDDYVIYFATQGSIESYNFWKDSLTKLSRTQISLILKQNASLTEQSLLKWHAEFMKEHLDGELSKDDFISELVKLFPKGNPANYCDYAFSTIDIDKSGKISFVEFMNAVALIQPGDLKTRLGLVFSVCDYNNAQTIDDGKIVKFLEVIAELEHGEGAVNTNAAKSVARAIMELCGKSKDGAVNKEEFIDCCERNYDDLVVPFLPLTEKVVPAAASNNTTLPVQKKVGYCGGNACPSCDKCIDWSYDGDLDHDYKRWERAYKYFEIFDFKRWHPRPDATCNYNYHFYGAGGYVYNGHSNYGVVIHAGYGLCRCTK
ncbi:unnamed protein product [Rotaria socialis]|uniref:EF-hand domain-containing protein n=1 Tax=Rotaria socialis TaxID=392032 RepID=A0A817U139_9BILA|nr:unnamed protein product [Rotaria socialis]CAF3325091.1 unnamed protein product [Rotaria socialis]CAF3647841.1 unnamed protein product [Rotaria socialis]CAF3752929.1 unnamed protein product [Rotaria socialis]CAF4706626.1 unnamed protein product [Rotaria socialis]